MYKKIISINEDIKTEISICIPTYKRINPLIRCLESVLKLNKTNLKIEVVISSNAKLDEHVISFLKKNFKDTGYKLSVYEQEKNIGLYKNWNFLLNLASSEWSTILNDDDILDTKWTSYVLEYINSDNNNGESMFAPSIGMFGSKIPNMRSSSINKFFQKIRFYKKDYVSLNFFDILNRTVIGGVLNVLFKTEYARKISFFDEYHYGAADYLFISNYIIDYGGFRRLEIGGYYNWEDNDTLKKNRKAKFLIQSYKIRKNIILDQINLKPIRILFHYGNYIHLYLSYLNYREEDDSFRIYIFEKLFFSRLSIISKVPDKILRLILRVIYFFGIFKSYKK
tara:strand:- start:2011 stop:3024 length:1014 start_codon:yes stop_codon:yes gene_type:complete